MYFCPTVRKVKVQLLPDFSTHEEKLSFCISLKVKTNAIISAPFFTGSGARNNMPRGFIISREGKIKAMYIGIIFPWWSQGKAVAIVPHNMG